MVGAAAAVLAVATAGAAATVRAVAMVGAEAAVVSAASAQPQRRACLIVAGTGRHPHRASNEATLRI